MKKFLLFLAIITFTSIQTTSANNYTINTPLEVETPKDSIRLAELDRYWTMLAKTVEEGDFEGYKAAYHEDAVVVFATGKNKTSVPMTTALAGWEQGFKNTKEGKQSDSVEFRFSQRIGDEATAHETGIFFFTSIDSDGKLIGKSYTHFEMLFVKKDNVWYALMEYQKSRATQEEWDALK